MAKEPNWTHEEMECLKSVWEDTKIPVWDIVDKLGRKRETISAKARKMGLSRGHNKVFSVEEIEVLKKYYPHMSAKDLQLFFFPDKTEYQIICAGNNHNIKKTEEYARQQKILTGVENLKSIPPTPKGEDNPNWVERFILKCDNCGEPITRTKARTKDTNFCNNECLWEYRILANMGHGNPNWNGGYSTVKQYGRLCIRQWKIDSMKACGYKCIITGENFMDIHHVYPYHDIFLETIKDLGFEDLGNITLYNDKQIILFRNKIIENHYKYPLGVCLSREIHEEFHNKYGRIGCTIDDWNEFYNEKIVNKRS